MEVFRFPLQPLTDTDSPEIPEYLHLDLLHWAVYLAYLKNDADAGSLERASAAAQMFDVAFGEKKDAWIVEHQRKFSRRRVLPQWV